MTTIKYNLFALKLQLEVKNTRPYTWKEIASAVNAHPNTLQNIAGNKTARVDTHVMAGLLDFFAAEGMPITVADLFVITTTLDPLTLSATGTVKPGE